MMNVGAKYANRKNGQVVVIGAVDNKCKTVIVNFPDGSNRKMVWSNFNKSYKSMEAPEKTEDKPSKVETEKKATETAKPVENSSKQSGAKAEKKPEAETSKKEEKQGKPKKEQSAKPKAEKKAKKAGLSEDERTTVRDQMLAYFKKLSVDASVSEKYPMWVNVKFTDKNVFGIGLNPTNIRIRAISSILPKGIEFKAVKGGFDATVNFGYENKNEMYDMFKYAVENFKDSDEVKRKRKAKEPKVAEAKAV